MQREEKQLELTVDALLQSVGDMKTSVASLLMKVEHEHETINWPTFLDSFALLSGQFNTLLRLLKNEKTPPLRNYILLPLLLTPDRDEDLAKMTENRVATFSHDLVPDYLRTKADPELEQKHTQMEMKANQVVNIELMQKQITLVNKIINTVLDTVNTTREEWETESTSRANSSQTSSVTDTQFLLAAVGMGKGIKNVGLTIPGRAGGPPNVGNTVGVVQQMSQVNKAPSAIKTNIKAQVHPYGR